MQRLLVSALFLFGLFASRTLAQTDAERIAKLEAKIEQLTPLVQQVNDLKVQLAQLQGKLESLDTKLNIALAILSAVGLAVLGQLAKSISDRLSTPPPTAASRDSLTMERFEGRSSQT